MKAAEKPWQDPEVGIVAAVPDPWDDLWTTRHHILTKLSQYYWTVWMNPAPGWRHLAGNLSVPRFTLDPRFGRFLVYESGLLPVIYRPKALGRALDKARLRRAVKELHKKGCTKIFLYLWRPDYAHYLQLQEFDASIYHIDDEYSFSEEEQPVPTVERRLIESVDHVIIHSPALLEKKGQLNPSTTWIPNGVNYKLFSSPRDEPADMQAIPHPRAGYVGIIKKQLDLKALLQMAEKRGDISFVLVGPRGMLGADEQALDQLVAMPNVYELGNKKPEDLPAYMQHMDVLLMCYKIDAYTKYIYPLKLHEYLATGNPVISTPLPTVVSFKNVVMLAETHSEWQECLSASISAGQREPARVQARQRTAQEYDWQRLCRKIAGIVSTLSEKIEA